jgi:uncharacterized membrane protein
MRLRDRALDLLPWAIATLIVAGLVHIVSVLLMPAVAPRDALARLEAASALAKTTEKGVTLLAPAGSKEAPLPFEDPAMVEGVCLFDLSKGMVRVNGAVEGDEFLAISFHSGSGKIFHAMTDRSAIKGKIDFVVGDARQIDALESGDSDEAPPQEVRLTSPSRRGFVLIRALARRPYEQERALARVSSLSCGAYEPPEE